MKMFTIIILIAISELNAYAQNPYEIFGYKSKFEYKSKVAGLFILFNKDESSSVKAIAFDYGDNEFILFGRNDSIIKIEKIEPNRLLRFMRIDPLSKDYPGISPYAFVANNPVNAIDPDGRKILFVNGYYQDNWLGRNIIGASKGGKEYWGDRFSSAAQVFFNDFSKIRNSNFIDGSSSWGGDMSGQDRYEAGMAYAKANLKVLTEGMVQEETFKMVTHSEGSAYGAGVTQYLLDQGYKVETVIHLSADEGDEFSTPASPSTFQLGYDGDWVTGNKMIKDVDIFGLVNSGFGWQYVHGSTLNTTVFNQVKDLTTVQTQDNIGMVNGKASAWKTQIPGTATYGTDFTIINGVGIMNQEGKPKN